MYSSVLDVRNALTPGAVSTDNSTAASLGDAQITDAILEADAKVDTYLPAGYTVPVQTVSQGDPPADVSVAHNLIRFWSRNIAAYLATLTYKKNKDVVADDPVRLRYEMTLEDLKQVRSGVILLPTDASTADDISYLSIYNQYDGTMFAPEDFDLATVPGTTVYYRRSHGMWS